MHAPDQLPKRDGDDTKFIRNTLPGIAQPVTLEKIMGKGELGAIVEAFTRGGDQDARARLIEAYLPLVRSIARRFAGRGERVEDLVQVGSLALVGAVDRCDGDRPYALTSYVARCVEGEIRRHLRDRCSVVRVPRDVQKTGGAPDPLPLDDSPAAQVPAPDQPEDTALTRVLVAAAARSLDVRERRVVLLRYFLDLSQAEVGQEVGISQVHVSRLLQTANAKMRTRLGDAGPSVGW
jgi:RNA polymerase sigma-B factor